ncbi:hypothetical protein Ahy_A10g049353 isoform A [Arachis hypogaea]|uniref:MULE transposase domain-containing protein n=1 Tax=Arachis hypogaea TaxID=3818 RepID=A0A445B710_ARAHY|nr:hypothetical protein Ahy_A10g049353 isoform A [Arachis hypogaea]
MAHDFYVTCAKKVGFATKIRTTTYDNITNIPVNQAIHCNRDGIYVKFDKDMQEWVLFKVELRHSHPCSTRKAAADLPDHACEVLRLRTSNVNADVKEIMNYFMRMKDINPNLFFVVKLDEDCKFRSAVYVDARCRASYEYYRDVVSVDSTYSTNRHGLPFVSFVGLNHHGKSTLLGCALLENEEIPSYEWVFSQWVKCIGTAPQRIITDQCRSIFCAIKNALPDTRHRWCICHITKKLPDLYDDLNDIVWNSQTKESFEDNWSKFIDEYNLQNKTWFNKFGVRFLYFL